MDKSSDIKFQIKAVELLNFELMPLVKHRPANSVFHYNVSVEYRANTEDKLIYVIVGVEVLHKDKETLAGSMNVSCVFIFENFDKLIDMKIVDFGLPKEIIDVLNSISISSTRGVMASTFRGTILHNAVLPILNPQDFKKKQDSVLKED
jgi:hypothetical protein